MPKANQEGRPPVREPQREARRRPLRHRVGWLGVLVVVAACTGGDAPAPRGPADSVPECTNYFEGCEIVSGVDGCPVWYGSINTCSGPDVSCCRCPEYVGVCRVNEVEGCRAYHYATNVDVARRDCAELPPELGAAWIPR